MARKPRVISAPQARGGSDENGWIQRAGTMGNLLPDGGPIGHLPYDTPPDGAFEAPDDVNYDRVIAERERELGLPAAGVSGAADQPYVYSGKPGSIAYVRDIPRFIESPVPPLPEADLTPLPDKFELIVERVNGSWKITSPLHVGLWRAGADLPAVIEEALGALAMMIAVDGPKPKGRRK